MESVNTSRFTERLAKRSRKNNPSRASIRLYQKQKQSDTIAEQAKRKRTTLRVSRTVELVNQNNDAWREEKSKLLYMLSLGLTPKSDKPIIGPIIRVTPADPATVARVLERHAAERALRLANRKAARHQWRLRRLNAIRSLKKQPDAPIEIIDLSDDEDTDSKGEIIMPQSKYPNLTIAVSRVQPGNLGPTKMTPTVPRPLQLQCRSNIPKPFSPLPTKVKVVENPKFPSGLAVVLNTDRLNISTGVFRISKEQKWNNRSSS